MRGLLLPWIAHMGRKRMIEGLTVDVLRVRRKMVANGGREIDVLTIWHALLQLEMWVFALKATCVRKEPRSAEILRPHSVQTTAQNGGKLPIAAIAYGRWRQRSQ